MIIEKTEENKFYDVGLVSRNLVVKLEIQTLSVAVSKCGKE